jgi:hypothetical protein
MDDTRMINLNRCEHSASGTTDFATVPSPRGRLPTLGT